MNNKIINRVIRIIAGAWGTDVTDNDTALNYSNVLSQKLYEDLYKLSKMKFLDYELEAPAIMKILIILKENKFELADKSASKEYWKMFTNNYINEFDRIADWKNKENRRKILNDLFIKFNKLQD